MIVAIIIWFLWENLWFTFESVLLYQDMGMTHLLISMMFPTARWGKNP
ncbi:hypothetical protein GECvBGOT_gp043c [Salmonella phage GEC_vB_GOT]|nr:hypothetical protein GECvBGOT_gp043c [Salmonella phage GEC_vB_GOT]